MVITEKQLQDDLQAAMRAREMPAVYVLRGVIAAVKNLKIDKQVAELPETDIIGLIRKEASKRKEAMSFAEKGGRADLIEQNRSELAILDRYLPQQLSEENLEAIVRQLAEELGTTQIGPIMAELRKRHAGQFDGAVASRVIKRLA